MKLVRSLLPWATCLAAGIAFGMILWWGSSAVRAAAPRFQDPPQAWSLPCPAGFVALPGFIGRDASGNFRAVACADPLTGEFFLQPDAAKIGGVSPATLPVSLMSGVSGILSKTNGGTGTATPGLSAGAGISLSGTWPNQTITSTATGGVSEALIPTCGPHIFFTTAGETGCQFFFSDAHTLTRIEVYTDTAPVGCTTDAVGSLYDVTASAALGSVTLTSGAGPHYDSGALSISIPAGHTITWDVTTAASGCSTSPQGYASATYN